MKRLITTLVASLFLTSLASGEAASGLPYQEVTHTSAAHEAYLKGESERSKNTVESVRNAIEHFEEAIERDPSYAPAYLAMADSYHSLGQVFLAMPPHEAVPKAEELVKKAFQLDNSLGEAHSVLGLVKTNYSR